MLIETQPHLAPAPRAAALPRHVAIIMDGNGRWAQQRRLPRLAGHRAGTENIKRLVRAVVELGIPYLTIYAFSTENWQRPPDEVKGLFSILREVIDREARALHEQGVQIRHLGRIDGIPPGLQRAIRHATDLTKDNQRLVLAVAFNYGGRQEILQAVQRIVSAGLPPEAVTEEVFAAHLNTAGLPDPDLIVRTGGELRLSNFLIWQAAYAEYYATPTLWPDFRPDDLAAALGTYCQRQRRFGRLGEQDQALLPPASPP